MAVKHRGIQDVTVKSPRGKDNVHVTYVSSDTDALTTYEIVRRPLDGAILCGCTAFVFNRDTPRTCKHIRAYQQAGASRTYSERQRVAERGKMPTERVETFTFRRAITFDDDIPIGR